MNGPHILLFFIDLYWILLIWSERMCRWTDERMNFMILVDISWFLSKFYWFVLVLNERIVIFDCLRGFVWKPWTDCIFWFLRKPKGCTFYWNCIDLYWILLICSEKVYRWTDERMNFIILVDISWFLSKFYGFVLVFNGI